MKREKENLFGRRSSGFWNFSIISGRRLLVGIEAIIVEYGGASSGEASNS